MIDVLCQLQDKNTYLVLAGIDHVNKAYEKYADKKGVKDRVFFLDEETAIKAVYRPCAVCMPEKYKEWKED